VNKHWRNILDREINWKTQWLRLRDIYKDQNLLDLTLLDRGHVGQGVLGWTWSRRLHPLSQHNELRKLVRADFYKALVGLWKLNTSLISKYHIRLVQVDEALIAAVSHLTGAVNSPRLPAIFPYDNVDDDLDLLMNARLQVLRKYKKCRLNWKTYCRDSRNLYTWLDAYNVTMFRADELIDENQESCIPHWARKAFEVSAMLCVDIAHCVCRLAQRKFTARS
jgi:hypothetical protein